MRRQRPQVGALVDRLLAQLAAQQPGAPLHRVHVGVDEPWQGQPSLEVDHPGARTGQLLGRLLQRDHAAVP
jgi:hypothetical protein